MTKSYVVGVSTTESLYQNHNTLSALNEDHLRAFQNCILQSNNMHFILPWLHNGAPFVTTLPWRDSNSCLPVSGYYVRILTCGLPLHQIVTHLIGLRATPCLYQEFYICLASRALWKIKAIAKNTGVAESGKKLCTALYWGHIVDL